MLKRLGGGEGGGGGWRSINVERLVLNILSRSLTEKVPFSL